MRLIIAPHPPTGTQFENGANNHTPAPNAMYNYLKPKAGAAFTPQICGTLPLAYARC